VFGALLAVDSSGIHVPRPPLQSDEPERGTENPNREHDHEHERGTWNAEPGTAMLLESVARDFSPRIEVLSHREVVLDLHGLDRLIGDAPRIAAELRRTAADRDLRVRVAIADTRTAARLLVHAHAGVTIAEPGDERHAVAHLAIDMLRVVVEAPDLLTLRRWGLRTLGDLAALPDDQVAARLGQPGVAWQRLARGEDPRPLVPALPEERFEQALDLEWPIDGLEPLSFVLGRLMEPLSAHLEQRDRAAAVLHVRLHLIKNGVTREVHARSLQLPAPMRDARTLRTLAMLDLESHPPAAAIDRVVVAVDPTPGRIVQFSLLTRPLPSPEQLSTLMARLTALMGEGRSGSPADVDSWKPGAFGMTSFAPHDATDMHCRGTRRHVATEKKTFNDLRASVSPFPVTAVRRFRHPVPVRVRVEQGKPSRLTTDRRGLDGGSIRMCAGPSRSSGAWWESDQWNRDEWDVTLTSGETYRLFHDRESGNWFLDGLVD
jgi:protein ImuB